MRFGKTLKKSIYPPWADKYIDYDKLKQLLRERDIKNSGDPDAQPWTDKDEEAFVQELINVQLDKVNAFQSETSKQLRQRTEACDAKLRPLLPDEHGRHEVEDEEKRREIASEVLGELDSITKEVSELEKYSRINFTGFLKAAKKHDRKRGSQYRVRPLLQVRLSQHPFNSEDYSPLLNRLSAMYTFARQVLTHEPAETTAVSGPDGRAANDIFISYKFWVHSDNIVEVKTHILRRLPVLLYNPTGSKELDVSQPDPTITSIYFDNPQFDLYNKKVTRTANAESLRLQWSGDLKDKPAIFLEKKIVTDDQSGRNVRIPLKEKHVNEFLKGEYRFEKHIHRLEDQARGESHEAENLKRNVEELSSFIKENNLQPMLRANFRRTAFQIPGDDRIRISLDTDLALIREDALDPERPCRDPNDWHRRDIDDNGMQYPFESINENEIVRFPHALLEIKLRQGARNIEWLNDLMVSHLVKETPRFSKFVHGVAQLFEDNINTFPFWLSELENDIRRDTETAFQEEQERMAKLAEDQIAVGSYLGGPRGSPQQQGLAGSPMSRIGSISGPPIIDPRGSVSGPGRAAAAKQQAEAQAREAREQRQDRLAVPDGQDRSRSPGGSFLSGLVPSFSMSRYARAHRAQKQKLPAGVSPPEIWIKDAGPVRVESKVWLANQRTYVKWQHIAILLASLSLALYNAAGEDNQVAQLLAIVYLFFAAFASVWGWYMYHTRARLIRQRSGKDLDNLFGPIVVCVGLAGALLLNFAFRVSHILLPDSTEWKLTGI